MATIFVSTCYQTAQFLTTPSSLHPVMLNGCRPSAARQQAPHSCAFVAISAEEYI